MRIRFYLIAMAILAALTLPLHAQWVTQSILVKPGWTAVYLNVDPSYESIDQLVGADAENPIVEIWRWQAPISAAQYITSPVSPLSSGSDWAVWKRAGQLGNSLGMLMPNSAYLIHSTAATNYLWKIKGKPVAPDYTWTTTGLNFIGFSTSRTNPPPFDTFFALAPGLAGAGIYQYPGGDLGGYNPSQVIALHATRVVRGQAFWIRAGTTYNNYFGPFMVSGFDSGGIVFSDTGSQYSFHLRNTSATNVTVSLRLLPSESAPAGQPAIVGTPPILMRGNLDDTNLTYRYTDLTRSNISWTLPPAGQPGSDIAVVLGVNRSAMNGGSSGLYAGILEFTDARGFLQVDVPVSAQPASLAGLWVGKALVSQVGNYLKSYERTNGQPVMGPDGSYIVTNVNTSLGAVAQAFPLRLILHNDGGNVVLLQRVYFGQDTFSNLIVSTTESALDPSRLASARRISSVTLPWTSADTPWPFTGRMADGATLTTEVDLPYDDQASNPFLHTYHPDHDNLDATFQNELPRGVESYDIDRTISLTINPVGHDFDSLTRSGQTFSGAYAETIKLLGNAGASRTFHVTGSFAINRISPIATLTTQP